MFNIMYLVKHCFRHQTIAWTINTESGGKDLWVGVVGANKFSCSDNKLSMTRLTPGGLVTFRRAQYIRVNMHAVTTIEAEIKVPPHTWRIIYYCMATISIVLNVWIGTDLFWHNQVWMDGKDVTNTRNDKPCHWSNYINKSIYDNWGSVSKHIKHRS